MANPELELIKGSDWFKLYEPGDRISASRGSDFSILSCPAKPVKDLGDFFIAGFNSPPYGLDKVLVLDEIGLSIQNSSELRLNNDLHLIGIERYIMERQPLPVCQMKIEGYQFILRNQMSPGNLNLPEESFDSVYEWTMISEGSFETALMTYPESKYLSRLRFTIQLQPH